MRAHLALRSAALAAALSSAVAVAGRQHQRRQRRLVGPFGSIAGYEPTTKVTDLAVLDLDQRTLESQLDGPDLTSRSFDNAKSIYLHGGHSGPYAILRLDPPLGDDVEEGVPVFGLECDSSSVEKDGAAAKEVEGRVAGLHLKGAEAVRVTYPSPRNPGESSSWAGAGAGGGWCRVGALKEVGEASTSGCYAPTGSVTIDGRQYTYQYDVLEDTLSHVSLSSLGDDTMRVMDRPMAEKDFLRYYDYYLEPNFGHHWVLAALGGTKVDYPGRGDADFSRMSLEGRAEAARMGSAYINTHLYVLRLMRHAVARCRVPCSDECEFGDNADSGRGCTPCDDSAQRSWDEAVALYAGSLEGSQSAGSGSDGRFLHGLADDLCSEFGTCEDVDETSSSSSEINGRIMDHFRSGQMLLGARSCDEAEVHAERLWELAAVPLVQGLLRSAYRMDRRTHGEEADALGDDEEAEAERHGARGAAFAAAILPRIHGCDVDDAEVLYGSMRVGTLYTDFAAVKGIVESNYDCLGISCADVGGLLDEDAEEYLEGAGPCSDSDNVSVEEDRHRGPERWQHDGLATDEETRPRRSAIATLCWAFFAVAASMICACCVFERFVVGRRDAAVHVDDKDGAGRLCMYDGEMEFEDDDESVGEFL